MNESAIFDQNNNNQGSVIESVLHKTKFWEERLHHYKVSPKMKKRLLHTKTKKSLNALSK